MSAETLREAASLMRERAGAAAPGPWEASWAGGVQTAEKKIASAHNANDANAEHIASWHPAVALAVADWLDDTAGTWATFPRQAALAVARAYLGSES